MTLSASGIKVTPELAQIDVSRAAGVTTELETFLGALAERQVNLSFLTLAGPGARTVASLCVAATERSAVEQAGQAQPGLWPHLTVISPVVAVSVFPHRCRATLLTALLGAFHQIKLPVLAMGSSLAAITFTLGQAHLERALEVIEQTLELPPNHAPMYTDTVVKQLPE